MQFASKKHGTIIRMVRSTAARFMTVSDIEKFLCENSVSTALLGPYSALNKLLAAFCDYIGHDSQDSILQLKAESKGI